MRDTPVFEAWGDQPWVIDGANVRVSLICFSDKESRNSVTLDGIPVSHINSDLTSSQSDLTKATALYENQGIAFQSPIKVGSFEVPGVLARKWLKQGKNVNGTHNKDVVRPWANGMDVVRRPSDTWIIDFGEMAEDIASFYEAPFEHVKKHVKPERDLNRRDKRRIFWWQHGETVPGLRRKLDKVQRYIITPRVSKHRIFAWMHSSVLPDSATVAIMSESDALFGVLFSRFHEAWSLRLGSTLEDRPRYTPKSCFDTFPFPAACLCGSDIPAVSDIAKELADRHASWINPPDQTLVEAERFSKYPPRIQPIDPQAAQALLKHTLTNLYNARPTWLAKLHERLDAAVAAAYGWPEDISTEDALTALLELNRERAAAQGKA